MHLQLSDTGVVGGVGVVGVSSLSASSCLATSLFYLEVGENMLYYQSLKVGHLSTQYLKEHLLS